jgi:hypothetical protein
VQVDGLTRAGSGSNGSNGSNGGGSLADQAVAAALTYRTQQPLIDALLAEIGIKGGTLSGMTQAMIEPKAPEAAQLPVERKAPPPPASPLPKK